MVKVVDIPAGQKQRHKEVIQMLKDNLAFAEHVNEMVAGIVVLVGRDGNIYCESITDGYKAPALGALDIAKHAIMNREQHEALT